MSLQRVLNALRFYSGSNFPVSGGYAGDVFSQEHEALIRQDVSKLYNNSAKSQDQLESLAAAGNIYIAYSPTNSGAHVLQYDSNGGVMLNYLLLDPEQGTSAFNHAGQVYDIPFIVTLAHELSHYATNANDPFDPADPSQRNEVWNDPSYDWYGANLPYENSIVSELVTSGLISGDPSPLRAGYRASFSSDQLENLGFGKGISYTSGQHVDVVRLGDFESSKDDNISMEGNGNSLLIFGLLGDDTVKTGLALAENGSNFAYGGKGNDKLSSTGRNYLYGEAGNDTLIAEGDHKSYLFGGDGDDLIFARNADVDVGSGADQVWVPLGGTVTINGGDADDVLYLDGYQITGGQGRLVNIEKVEDDGSGFPPFYTTWDVFDHNGVYFSRVNDALEISLPDTKVTINNWVDGMFGIHLDHSMQWISFRDYYSWGDGPDEVYVEYQTGGPDTPLKFNGQFDSGEALMHSLYETYASGPLIFPDMFI